MPNVYGLARYAQATELTFGEDVLLYSYAEPVAAIIAGQAYRTDEPWSATTCQNIAGFFKRRGIDAREGIEERPQEWFCRLGSLRLSREPNFLHLTAEDIRRLAREGRLLRQEVARIVGNPAPDEQQENEADPSAWTFSAEPHGRE